MANTRELQSRMKSIKDTMKITSAMHMIASSNLQKAKKNLEETEPYFYTLQIMIAGILGHMQGGIEHQYFDERPEIKEADRKKGYIVVTADKGLAGGYNHNVIKLAQEFLDKPGHNELFVLGQLGRSYFQKKNVDVDTSFKYTVQKPTMLFIQEWRMRWRWWLRPSSFFHFSQEHFVRSRREFSWMRFRCFRHQRMYWIVSFRIM